jgi:hypothetical protein
MRPLCASAGIPSGGSRVGAGSSSSSTTDLLQLQLRQVLKQLLEHPQLLQEVKQQLLPLLHLVQPQMLQVMKQVLQQAQQAQRGTRPTD